MVGASTGIEKGWTVYGADGGKIGEVDEIYQRARPGFQEHFDARRRGQGARADRTFADAEPHYRAGYAAGRDERYAGQAFEQAEPSLRRDYATPGSDADTLEELREEV